MTESASLTTPRQADPSGTELLLSASGISKANRRGGLTRRRSLRVLVDAGDEVRRGDGIGHLIPPASMS